MARESGFGEHLADYSRDVYHTYFTAKKGVLDHIAGFAMIFASLFAEGPDQLYDGALGRMYEAPRGILGRTRRDLRLLMHDMFPPKPLRAAGDAWRLLTSDVPLDVGDMATKSRTRTMAA